MFGLKKKVICASLGSWAIINMDMVGFKMKKALDIIKS